MSVRGEQQSEKQPGNNNSKSGSSLPDREIEVEAGCTHYKRNCRLIAPCCNKVYPCRVCHDELESHNLDRKLVQELECIKCLNRSPIRADCGECGVIFGTAYFCAECRLFDNQDKGQFHCDGCAICRVGGQANYEHCSTCGMCMPSGGNHKCIDQSSKNNCPICFENIHSSRTQAIIPPCGHLIHTPCYKKMFKKGLYSCPTCGRALQDMSQAWQRIDREVAATPMPSMYRDLFRKVLCKDCSKTSHSSFHVIGMKCAECGSYNTSDEGPFTRKTENGYVELTDAELERFYAGPISDADGPVEPNVVGPQQENDLINEELPSLVSDSEEDDDSTDDSDDYEDIDDSDDYEDVDEDEDNDQDDEDKDEAELLQATHESDNITENKPEDHHNSAAQ